MILDNVERIMQHAQVLQNIARHYGINPRLDSLVTKMEEKVLILEEEIRILKELLKQHVD